MRELRYNNNADNNGRLMVVVTRWGKAKRSGKKRKGDEGEEDGKGKKNTFFE